MARRTGADRGAVSAERGIQQSACSEASTGQKDVAGSMMMTPPMHPQSPGIPPQSPIVYSAGQVEAKLREWVDRLREAQAIHQEHPATQKCICERCARLRECREELDKWLDEFLAVRGR